MRRRKDQPAPAAAPAAPAPTPAAKPKPAKKRAKRAAPAAQQAAPAQQPAPAQQGQGAQQPVQLIFSPWTKFCLGMPVAAAVLIEPEGQERKILRVTLPLGMQLAHGTRVIRASR
jgi:hypothetical protein